MHVLPFDKFTKGSFRIAFLGDIMCREDALPTVANDDPFKFIRKLLSMSDYVVGNLETTFSGETTDYPKFSSNDLLADQLSGMVDLLFTANNHSYDFGESGVKRTIEVLDEFAINHIGTNDLPKIRRVFDEELSKHKLSFLNYTTFLNETEIDPIYKRVNTPTPPANLINLYNKTKAKETINLAKERSEIVIVGIHQSPRKSNARELARESSREQRQFLVTLSQEGADVVVGGHPHHFQGGEILEDGKIIVYSLGNFYTTMNQRNYRNNVGCIMFMNCDSFSNIYYSFLPICTIKNEKTGHYFVIPISPLEGGYYDWVSEKQRDTFLQELEEMRKILRTCALIEEEVPIQFL